MKLQPEAIRLLSGTAEVLDEQMKRALREMPDVRTHAEEAVEQAEFIGMLVDTQMHIRTLIRRWGA